MLAIAGKTAGPNWLKFSDTLGYPRGNIGSKIDILFSKFDFFAKVFFKISRVTPDTSANLSLRSTFPNVIMLSILNLYRDKTFANVNPSSN